MAKNRCWNLNNSAITFNSLEFCNYEIWHFLLIFISIYSKLLKFKILPERPESKDICSFITVTRNFPYASTILLAICCSFTRKSFFHRLQTSKAQKNFNFGWQSIWNQELLNNRAEFHCDSWYQNSFEQKLCTLIEKMKLFSPKLLLQFFFVVFYAKKWKVPANFHSGLHDLVQIALSP